MSSDPDEVETALSRRALLTVGGAASLLAVIPFAQSDYSGPTGNVGIGSEPDVLQVGPGESYTISSGHTESYREVRVAHTGTLDVNGTLNVEGAT